MLRQEVADLNDGFYTQGEYDIAPLLAAKPDYSFMELGRSCVLKPYRNKRTLELLVAGRVVLCARARRRRDGRLRELRGHRSFGACRGAELPASHRARARGLAGARASSISAST